LDHAHFATIHKFRDFVVPKPMEIDGARIYTEYGGTKPIPVIGGISFHFRSVLVGLGFSLVEIAIQGGLTVRQMVLPTPVAERNVGLAQKGYGQGLVTILEVVQAQRQQAELKAAALNTLDQYLQALVRLHTAVGDYRHLPDSTP